VTLPEDRPGPGAGSDSRLDNAAGPEREPEKACALSVIVPTRNEAPNVGPLAHRVGAVLDDRPGGWELVFVDDSDDATPQLVRGLVDLGLPVRLLHREKADRQGGLGGAVQEGFAMARGDVVAVMDADLQHPPEALPALVAPVLSGEAALVAGSRYGWAGGDSGLSGPWRHFVSGTCRGLVHLLVPASRPLQDPLSGFFALRRSLLDGVQLQPAGYKILLEVVVRAKPAPVANVGFDFAPRHAGRSKANLHEGLMFLRHLSRLVVNSWRSRRGNGLVAANAAHPADGRGGSSQVQPPSA
jgi:glycosyltransferase involved in cell wall biosynthesis